MNTGPVVLINDFAVREHDRQAICVILHLYHHVVRIPVPILIFPIVKEAHTRRLWQRPLHRRHGNPS